MKIIFFPIFTDTQDLTDHYYRLHWYLYPFCDKIDQITLLYEGVKEDPIEQLPDYLDPLLLELRGKIPAVNLVNITNGIDQDAAFSKSDVILLWKIDPDEPDKIPSSPLKNLIKKRKIIRVDHNAERFAGSFYLMFAELFPDEIRNYETVSRQTFSEITERCRNQKGYIFGTGPGLSSVKDYDFTDGTSIACNSMVRNRGLLDRLKPPLIVIADPIFHAGPSSYAAAFRRELVEALDRYNSYLVVPLRDYHVYRAYLPSRFHSRMAAIPFKKESEPNLDLTKKYYVTSTANVLTLFLMPLASTFFKETLIYGCDGRPMDDNGYFWGHDKASQFNEQMEKIKEAHPAFFILDYNDYYIEHCKILDKWLTKAEKHGNNYTNITPSYIPALRDRYIDPLSKTGEISEVIILDPDAMDHFGHYLSFDDKLYDACRARGLAFSVFGNVNCSSDIVDARPFFEPVFSLHSWTIGNKPKGAKVSDLDKFRDELMRALRLRRERGLTRKTLLYMYCGSFPVAKIVKEVLKEYENVSAVICLFWLSFLDYSSLTYVRAWKPFLQECLQSNRVSLTLTTKRLATGVKDAFGKSLPVASHPSMTFSDIEAKLLFEEQMSGAQHSLNILFPGGLRSEKGFYLTADFAPRLAVEFQDRFRVIVRTYVNSNTPGDIIKLVTQIEKSGCRSYAEHMEDKGFAEFLKEGDIIVLPYQAPDFSERTSGLVIDALYLGIPVIVWENTWLADIVEEYKNGVIVKGKDYSAFKNALIKLVDQFDSYVCFAKKAQRSYLLVNSWDRFVDSIVNPNAIEFEDMLQQEGENIISNNGVQFLRENRATLDETRVIAHVLKDSPADALMIDVGGHHGSALAPFSKMGWRVLAFEPDPKNRKYLMNRYGDAENILIDPRAVGERAETGVKFYASEESTGISGMLAFRESHKLVDTVDVTTVADIITDNNIEHIEFLKIDVEGYDFSVLKGVPWERLTPDVIECEFEDAKTKHLGHSWRDICEYLVERGYTIYVSEWHPIIRYGICHDWLGLKRYPCELEDSNAWGNLLAFKNDRGAAVMQEALIKVIKVEYPEKIICAPESQNTAKTSNKTAPHIKETKQPVLTTSNSKRDGKFIMKRRVIPRYYSYSHFTEWLKSKNLTLFRVGQFVMWAVRFFKRHTQASVLGLVVMSSLVAMPFLVPQLATYGNYFWVMAGLLVLSAISIMGVSFGNRKMKEFAERELHFRQALRAEMMRELQKKQDQLAARIEDQQQQQVGLTGRLTSQSQKQDELITAVDELKAQDDKMTQSLDQLIAWIEEQQQHAELSDRVNTQTLQHEGLSSEVKGLHAYYKQMAQSQTELATRVEEQGQQQVEGDDKLDRKFNQLVASAPVFNYGDYQSFNRRLTKAHIDVLLREWSGKLSLKVTPKSLAYLAHRICTLESASRGRLATTIEDAVLRVIVASAVKSKNLRVLEIGTLFGIGLAAIHDHARSRFNSVHLTAIDPLDGYYGKDVRDIVTDEIVDEKTFRTNLETVGVPENEYALIKLMSTDDTAIELAAKSHHDVLIIDGDHSYVGVKADFVNYLSSVKKGGYIIFDDYNAPDWPDVKKFVDTTVRDHPEVTLVGTSWRTAVFQVVCKAEATN